VSCWVPATGIRTKLPLARLKPAVGPMFRQAPSKLRQGEKRPSYSIYQTDNPSEVLDRQQVIDLRPRVRSVLSGSSAAGRRLSADSNVIATR